MEKRRPALLVLLAVLWAVLAIYAWAVVLRDDEPGAWFAALCSTIAAVVWVVLAARSRRGEDVH